MSQPHRSRGRAGSQTQAGRPADHLTHAERGQDRSPGSGSTQGVLRDVGAKDEQRRDDHQVKDGRLADHDPQPGARAKLLPAVAQIAQEAAGLPARLAPRQSAGATGKARRETTLGRRQRTGRRGDGSESAQPPQKPGAHEVRQGVEADRPARTQGRHHHAAQGGAQSHAEAVGQPSQSVGLLQVPGADGLGHEARLRRPKERLGGAAHELQDDQLPDRRLVGDEQPGHGRLADEAHDVGDQHHPLPREAVGPHAADQQKEHERNETGGHDDAEVGLRTDLEHGEGQRDRGDRAADERERLAREEQPEVSLAQGLEHARA